MTKIFLAEDFAHTSNGAVFWSNYGTFVTDPTNLYLKTSNSNTTGLVFDLPEPNPTTISSSIWFQINQSNEYKSVMTGVTWFNILGVGEWYIQARAARYTVNGINAFRLIKRLSEDIEVIETFNLDRQIPIGRWQYITISVLENPNRIEVYLFDEVIISSEQSIGSVDKVSLINGFESFYTMPGLFFKGWLVTDELIMRSSVDPVLPIADIDHEMNWRPNLGTVNYNRINHSSGIGDGDNTYVYSKTDGDRDLYVQSSPLYVMANPVPIGLTINTVAKGPSYGTRRYKHVLRNSSQVIEGPENWPADGVYNRHQTDFTINPNTGAPWTQLSQITNSNPGILLKE